VYRHGQRHGGPGYSLGELYAYVVPPGNRAWGARAIEADRYAVRREGDRWYVDVAFRLELPNGALYTVVMYANSAGIRWEPVAPVGGARPARCKVFTYATGVMRSG